MNYFFRIIFFCKSTFNCGSTAFKKLDMGWVLTAQFPWQQQHHAGASIQEANMRRSRPEPKPLVVKVWGWLPTDHRWQGQYQWRKWLQACVQTKGQHFEQLLYFVLPLNVYCLHWLKIFDDREIKTYWLMAYFNIVVVMLYVQLSYNTVI